jgi:preprotein translocase subunit YajC
MMDTQLMMILVPVVVLMNIVAYFVFIPRKYRNRKEKTSSENRKAVSFPSEILPSCKISGDGCNCV